MAIEIRQLRAARVLHEEGGIPREDEALTGDVVRQDKRSQPDELAGDAVSPHWLVSVPASKAACSLCFGKIGRLSRIRRPVRWFGKGDDHRARVGRADLELLADGLQRVGKRARGLLVVHRANENNTSSAVNGWPSRRSRRVAASACSAGRRRTSSSFRPATGSTSWETRSMRTSLACVRIETSSVLESRPFARRLNDAGSVRHRHGELAAPGDAGRDVRGSRWGGRLGGPADANGNGGGDAKGDGDEDAKLARVSGQILAHWSENWPIKIVGSSAGPEMILHAKSCVVGLCRVRWPDS